MIFKNKGNLWYKLFFLVFISLAVTALMVLYIDRLPASVVEGNIAPKDIRADKNYNIVDADATNKLKEQAVQRALPIYNYDVNLVSDEMKKIAAGFAKARSFLKTYFEENPAKTPLSEEDEERLKQIFLFNLGQALEENDYGAVRKDGFLEELEKTMLTLYETAQKKPIVFDPSELSVRGSLGIILRPVNRDDPEAGEEVVSNYARFLALADAKKVYENTDVDELQKRFNFEFVDKEKFKLALSLIPSILKVTVSLDKAETEMRRERALENVQTIEYKFKRGQTIIRRGEVYEAKHVAILQGIAAARQSSNLLLKFLGVFGLTVITLIVLYFFSTQLKGFKLSRKDINFIGLMLVLFLAILRLGSFMGAGLKDSLPFATELGSFYYLIPVAAGAMLVRYILTAEVAIVFSFALSLFAGLFLELNYLVTVYYFLSSLAASHLIARAQRRSTVIRRGLYLGIVNVLLVLCLNLILAVSMATNIDPQTVTVTCAFAFSSGLLVALTLLALAPIMETIFNYTTDIQLLELANLNHPLLREMIVRAPGTYHHSQLVGILAEAGAREIGANALLARVGSYYHDIGKMKKPQYFVENQKGDNPHDHLAPSMSALVIDAHVKDGMEMAKEYKLPKVIADFIPQHQGTKLIGFFYHKAKTEAQLHGESVDERGYHYHGPKPQSREAALIMLADTVEAAVRSLPDKSPQKIRAQVEKLVSQHFVGGQLDECDLTLKDINLLVGAFIKILIGIYHQRVEYPEDDKKQSISLISKAAGAELPGHGEEFKPAASNISLLFKHKNQDHS